MYIITCKCNVLDIQRANFLIGERVGVVVEHQTRNQEVLGSFPFGCTMLCPYASFKFKFWTCLLDQLSFSLC